MRSTAPITLCRGGRPAPILFKADGTIKVGQSGHAIGVFDAPNLTKQEVHIAPREPLCSTSTA
jgi:hypothetical protein